MTSYRRVVIELSGTRIAMDLAAGEHA